MLSGMGSAGTDVFRMVRITQTTGLFKCSDISFRFFNYICVYVLGVNDPDLV